MHYTIFQRQEIIQDILTRRNNNCFCITLDLCVSKTRLINAVLKLNKLFRHVLSASYHQNGITRKKFSADNVFAAVKEVSGQDNIDLITDLQNKQLDLFHGQLFDIVLNQNKDSSSIIMAFSHVVTDGISLQIYSLLLVLLLSKQYVKFYMMYFMTMLHNCLPVNISFESDKILPALDSYTKINNRLFSIVNIVNKSIKVNLKKINRTRFSDNIYTAALMAMNLSYPNEQSIQVRRIIGLRGKGFGFKSLQFGECHLSRIYLFDNSQIGSFTQTLRVFNTRVNSVVDDIQYAISSLRREDQVSNIYKILANDICTIAVSYFGFAPKINHLDNLMGSTSMCSGTKPNFLILCGFIGDDFFVVLQWNHSVVSREDALKLLDNFLDILLTNCINKQLANVS